MQISVEFFGIVRARARVSRVIACGSTLGELCLDLGRQFPELAQTCFEGSRLKTGYMANLCGERFVTDPATELHEGDEVMLLSMDAGG